MVRNPKPGTTVTYTDWRGVTKTGTVVAVSGQSALVDFGDVQQWCDVKNLEASE